MNNIKEKILNNSGSAESIFPEEYIAIENKPTEKQPKTNLDLSETELSMAHDKFTFTKHEQSEKRRSRFDQMIGLLSQQGYEQMKLLKRAKGNLNASD